MIGLRSRLAVALLVFGLCLVYALPSVPYIGTALENVLPSKKINLGLDLKGGIHLTLGVDVAKAVSNSLALAGQDIRRLAKDEKIVVLHPRVVGNDKLEFALPRVDDEAKLQEILQKNVPQLFAKKLVIFPVNTFNCLVAFFNQVFPNTFMSLRPIPRTSFLGAQKLHQGH